MCRQYRRLMLKRLHPLYLCKLYFRVGILSIPKYMETKIQTPKSHCHLLALSGVHSTEPCVPNPVTKTSLPYPDCGLRMRCGNMDVVPNLMRSPLNLAVRRFFQLIGGLNADALAEVAEAAYGPSKRSCSGAGTREGLPCCAGVRVHPTADRHGAGA